MAIGRVGDRAVQDGGVTGRVKCQQTEAKQEAGRKASLRREDGRQVIRERNGPEVADSVESLEC